MSVHPLFYGTASTKLQRTKKSKPKITVTSTFEDVTQWFFFKTQCFLVMQAKKSNGKQCSGCTTDKNGRWTQCNDPSSL